MKIRELLELMVSQDASDLHIKAGSPPGLRVHGKLVPIEGCDKLTPEDCEQLARELVDTEERWQEYEKNRDLDFSRGIPGLARFRINLFHQRDSCAIVMRCIPIDIPRMEDMNYPPVVTELCAKPRGLVLVTGPTGSGKSTTLAAMVDYINRSEEGHILTIEDPIEFTHKDKKCFVNQREIGGDSLSFSNALRAALREDPDIILVGEMRDLETISLAISASETGHLVFGTLHTTSAIQTVDRIVDVFPHEAQQQIRMQLSVSLQGVISQTLVPKVGGGRACAQEIMIANDPVRACIRDGKTPQLINALQTGSQYGMQTLESALAQLVIEGKVTKDDAIGKANSPESVIRILEQGENRSRPSGRPDRKGRTERQERSARPRPKAGMQDDFENFRAERSGRT